MTPLTRVERDGSGRRTTYEEIEVGLDLGSLEWVVQASQVQGLIENDDDYHEWYLVDSPFGPPIVPPLATYPPVRVLLTRSLNVRGLFYEFVSEFLAPMHYGERITISGHIADKWIKRDREYFAYEAEGRNEAGQIVFRTRRTHVLDYIPRTAPRRGEGVDSGIAAPQAPDAHKDT